MVKGKPWEISEVQHLSQLVEEGRTIDEICKVMVKTNDAIRKNYSI